jgi:hypothetical protein
LDGASEVFHSRDSYKASEVFHIQDNYRASAEVEVACRTRDNDRAPVEEAVGDASDVVEEAEVEAGQQARRIHFLCFPCYLLKSKGRSAILPCCLWNHPSSPSNSAKAQAREQV